MPDILCEARRAAWSALPADRRAANPSPEVLACETHGAGPGEPCFPNVSGLLDLSKLSAADRETYLRCAPLREAWGRWAASTGCPIPVPAEETSVRWAAFVNSPEASTVPASAWPSYRPR